MKKRNALSITAILFSITMFALVACSGNGTNDTPKKLIMTSLSYNDTSKVVSWSAVANAQRFELSLVGQGIEREATITAKNNATNKYEYNIFEQKNGIYEVCVVAIGDGINYTDSDPKNLDAHYTKRVGLQQLFMTTLSYDAETMTVSWDKVPNAIGYSLRVGSSEKSASHIIESGNKMQYTLTEQTSGKYIVNVIAKGDGLSHSDSDSVTLTVDYVKIIELPPLSMSPLSFDSESKNEHLGVLNTVLKYHLEKKRSDEKLILNRSVNPFYPIEQKDIDLS